MHVYIVSHFQAEACRSVAQAIKKCPNGMYAEIKYDGERVQVHKQGDRFEFFSRSLKPVQPHKVCVCVECTGLVMGNLRVVSCPDPTLSQDKGSGDY